MRKFTTLTAITALAVLGLTATGNAFVKQPDEPLAQSTKFECAPIGQPRFSDGNPIYKVIVTLTLDETGNDVKSLSAVRVDAEGNGHDRDDQFDNAKVWKTGNLSEWFWTGDQGGGRKMGGHLYETVKRNWMYEEEGLKNGKQDFFMTSYCHKVEDLNRRAASRN